MWTRKETVALLVEMTDISRSSIIQTIGPLIPSYTLFQCSYVLIFAALVLIVESANETSIFPSHPAKKQLAAVVRGIGRWLVSAI